MSDEIGHLKKPALFRRGEVRNIAEIVQNAPLRSQVSKTTHPGLCSLLIMTLGEDEKSPLFVIMVPRTPIQKSIKALADLLSCYSNRIFTIQTCILLNSRRE